jgi:hypothetical protein
MRRPIWTIAAAQIERFTAPVTHVVPRQTMTSCYSPAAAKRAADDAGASADYLTRVGADFWQFDHGQLALVA